MCSTIGRYILAIVPSRAKLNYSHHTLPEIYLRIAHCNSARDSYPLSVNILYVPLLMHAAIAILLLHRSASELFSNGTCTFLTLQWTDLKQVIVSPGTSCTKTTGLWVVCG